MERVGEWELGLDGMYIYSQSVLGPLHGPHRLVGGARCRSACLTGRVCGDRVRGQANHPRPRYPRRGLIFYQIHPRGKQFSSIPIP